MVIGDNGGELDKVLVLVTCASEEEARRLARSLVERRLAACASLCGPTRSWFSWKGQLEECAEVGLTLKTRVDRLEELEQAIRELHSYETPEIVVVPIVGGSRDYLDWMDHSLERRARDN